MAAITMTTIAIAVSLSCSTAQAQSAYNNDQAAATQPQSITQKVHRELGYRIEHQLDKLSSQNITENLAEATALNKLTDQLLELLNRRLDHQPRPNLKDGPER